MATDETTDSKPLMIRGDRLLLALDVLEAFRVFTGRRHLIPGVNPDAKNTPRELRYGPTMALIARKFGIHAATSWLQFGDCSWYILEPIRNFLSDNADHLPKMEFDVTRLIMQLDCVGVHARILRDIASGELTEADFKG